jgi:hypothetical protein
MMPELTRQGEDRVWQTIMMYPPEHHTHRHEMDIGVSVLPGHFLS